MKPNLLFTSLLAIAILFVGCDQQPHHTRHVHNSTPIVVVHDVSSDLFYGHDTVNNTWYRYTPPANERAAQAVSAPGVSSKGIEEMSDVQAPLTANDAIGTAVASSSIERGGFGSTGSQWNQTTTTSFGQGGSWSKVEPPAEAETMEQVTEETITTSEQGEALSEAQVETETAMDNTAEAASVSESDSSSSSDAGSSDSGGGDSGGDGGGGD